MENDPPPPDANGSRITRLWRELKRRHVVRVASVYFVVGWLVIQIASTTFAGFGIPIWAFRFVALMVVLGFPLSLILAWAFELTPEGIRTTRGARAGAQDAVPSPDPKSKRGWLWIAFAAAVPSLIFGTLALFFYLRSGPAPATVSEQVPVADAVSAVPSIAVLPLVNMSAVEENAYFAGGVHEDILTNLSKVEGVHVISRTSVMGYANSPMNLRDIGLELGARYIVEGSVRRIRNHVRVSAQLIDATNDAHLWAHHYDRELVDVFATQTEVAQEITNSLLLEIRPVAAEASEEMPTRSVKAYDLYLQAKSIDRSEPESESSLSRQRALLEAAVAEDPRFVEAWGFLNEISDHSIRNLLEKGWFVPDGGDREAVLKDLSQLSRRALDKAVSLDPDNIETLLARASDSVAEADPAFRAARKKVIDLVIEKDPDNAIAWYTLGWWYHLDGEEESAGWAFRKALDLDPLHARILYGSLVYFNAVQDTAMTELLWARIPQISTEKFTNPNLVDQNVYKLFDAFMVSADESLLRELDEAIEKSSGHFHSAFDEEFARLRLAFYQNRTESFVEGDNRYPLDPSSGLAIEGGRITYNLLLLEAYEFHGATEKARAIAEEILRWEKNPAVKAAVSDNVSVMMAVARAHATLGDTAEVRRRIEKIAERAESNAELKGGVIWLLSRIDLDRAASELLELAAGNPSHMGLDFVAAWFISHRRLLARPEVQAFYLKQGKWVQYLAKRMPEYAEYQNDVVSEWALQLQKAGRKFLEDPEGSVEAARERLEQLQRLRERSPERIRDAGSAALQALIRSVIEDVASPDDQAAEEDENAPADPDDGSP